MHIRNSAVLYARQMSFPLDDASQMFPVPEAAAASDVIIDPAERVPLAEAIDLGEPVSYYSTTHRAWLPAHITGHNYWDGMLWSYDLNIKRYALVSRVTADPVASQAASSSHTPSILQPAAAAAVDPFEPVVAPGEPSAIDGAEDAVSAVSDSDSPESEVDLGTPVDAPSVASTAAPGQPIGRVGHGRRAPRPARRFAPPCGCDCHGAPNHRLGPRGGHTRRCCCPMCGHRSVERGHGCHVRVPVDRNFNGCVICLRCRNFCLGLLRWGDDYYDRGAPSPTRSQ